MTVIATFSDARTTHLISDSLVTINKIDTVHETAKWLSTGLRLESSDQIKYEYREGLLKIWAIQPNLAIAFAGNVQLASTALEIIADKAKRMPISSYEELRDFMKQSVIPSVTPTDSAFEACGFINNGCITTKFKFKLLDSGDLQIESSSDKKVFYCIGSGEKDFLNIWERIPSLIDRSDVDPALTFSLVAEHLYLSQFLGQKNSLKESFIGGAINGVYSAGGQLAWQSSRTTLTFVNMGGTGFEAQLHWLPIIYKTWHIDGNLFSSSIFEQDGSFFQRITQYSNLLSNSIEIDPANLPAEMKTFNAENLTIILLPKGISNEFPAVLRANGKFNAFDEILKEGKIEGFRLNKQFFQKLEDSFFIASDYTIKMGKDRLEPMVAALQKRMTHLTQDANPYEWVHYQGDLAVRLMELGGNTLNMDMLSEALGRFLDAWCVAKKYDLPSITDAVYNVEQFLADLNKNLTNEQLNHLLQNNFVSLKQYKTRQ